MSSTFCPYCSTLTHFHLAIPLDEWVLRNGFSDTDRDEHGDYRVICSQCLSKGLGTESERAPALAREAKRRAEQLLSKRIKREERRAKKKAKTLSKPPI